MPQGRAPRNRTLALCLALTMGGGVSGAEAPLEQASGELDQVRARIEALRGEQHDTAERRAALLEELGQADREIDRLTQELYQREQDLQLEQRILGELAPKVERQRLAVERERGLLADQIRAAHAMGRQERLKLLLSQKDPAMASRMLVYYDYLNLARGERVAGLRLELERLQRLEKESGGEEARVAGLREDLERERSGLEHARRARGELLAALEQEIQTKDQMLQELEGDRQRLQRLVEGLQDESKRAEAQKAEEEKRAAEAARLAERKKQEEERRRAEAERLAAERKARAEEAARQEQERLARLREQELAAKEEAERRRLEQERLAAEQAARERAEREAAEQERQRLEQAAQEEAERLVAEQKAREQAERETQGKSRTELATPATGGGVSIATPAPEIEEKETAGQIQRPAAEPEPPPGETIEQIRARLSHREPLEPVTDPFPKRKGRMPWPVDGAVVAEFGSPRVGGLQWDGVVLEAPEGGEVRGVHPGKVVFADWLKGYGQLLVIDHGDGYMTLYGNNQTLLKKKGEAVAAGETIALAGGKGEASGAAQGGIYFGVRHRTAAANPAQWCIKGEK